MWNCQQPFQPKDDAGIHGISDLNLRPTPGQTKARDFRGQTLSEQHWVSLESKRKFYKNLQVSFLGVCPKEIIADVVRDLYTNITFLY